MTVTKIADRTALSYWFPKLQEAGIRTPDTVLVPMPVEAQQCVWAAFDGKDGTPSEIAAYNDFIERIRKAVGIVRTPAFLRTDYTSGKHEWRRTCYLPTMDHAEIAAHVFAIAEYSELNGDFGELPWDMWAVREYLPVQPVAICPRYEDMPVVREYRFFVERGRIRCWHPYWPLDALQSGGAEHSDAVFRDLCHPTQADDTMMKMLAIAVSEAIPGAWSVDLLETKRGWYVTDMAEAHKSWHWRECVNNPKRRDDS